MNFDQVYFHGRFRDYQSRVLDQADRYLADGKINIVAAPGSGKTVLGLELIRKIGKPCLIFSPTTAIREQWGERFRDLFLSDPEQFDGLFSTNLHDIKLLNSITYQALFTAMEKADAEDADDDCFKDVDLVREIQENHIGTICLDEAHHLKNEWQKALEKLMGIVGKSVKVIALTATPPYDSESNEWNRYLTMCGEVDEEIFVPELVARNTLCPHQDYIYFNYPAKEEVDSLQSYRQNAMEAVQKVGRLSFMPALCQRINQERDYDKLFSAAKEHIALLVLFRHYGFEISDRMVRCLVGKVDLPKFQMSFAETALRFLLTADWLTEPEKEQLIVIFKEHSVYQKRKLELVLDERLKRSLISSVGKLESIAQIAQSEFDTLGERLRMLVLTDYIKKESVAQIASADPFREISVVSIFETLRRQTPTMRIGVLSGSLVILPDALLLEGVKHTRKPICETGYSIIEIPGSTHQVVKLVGDLFAQGQIQTLVGTKSLLGEGWDAPCINALIMASFVGSFVLSNQMRGRAIRIDKANPDKTANIWHLVTVEPEYLFAQNKLDALKSRVGQSKKELLSYDYEVLKRRFDSFMGPHYDAPSIESGIERICDVRPPYDQSGIARINSQMLTRSKDRQTMAETWAGQVKDGSFHVVMETEADTQKQVPGITFVNGGLLVILAVLQVLWVVFSTRVLSVLEAPWLLSTFLIAVMAVIIGAFFIRALMKMLAHISPARSFKTLGKALYRALVACGELAPSAKVEAREGKGLSYVSISLRNADTHDQNIFNTAMAELLSPIENPRYLLIKKGCILPYRYRYSFACPSIIGRKKEYVEILAQKLKSTTGNFQPVYTRNENGRALILKCRKNSYITCNQKLMDKKYKVRRWE